MCRRQTGEGSGGVGDGSVRVQGLDRVGNGSDQGQVPGEARSVEKAARGSGQDRGGDVGAAGDGLSH